MRIAPFMLTIAAVAVALPVQAQVATGSKPAPASAASKYSVAETDVGTLMDNPGTLAVLNKHLPGFADNDQIQMARGMTLQTLQQFAPDKFTDTVLAAIDADLKKIN